MTKKNKELIEEVLIGVAAKEKLDKIQDYLKKNEEIKKEELLDIIDSSEDLDYML